MDQHVIVVVFVPGLDDDEQLEVIGPFESAGEAEIGKPEFFRSTRRMVVTPLSKPEHKE